MLNKEIIFSLLVSIYNVSILIVHRSYGKRSYLWNILNNSFLHYIDIVQRYPLKLLIFALTASDWKLISALLRGKMKRAVSFAFPWEQTVLSW